MEEAYYDNAFRAFEAGNDNACWVYIKKAEIIDRPSVSLLVNCVYRIWQSAKLKAENEALDASKKDEILDIVNDGFTVILGMDKAMHKYIEPLDYIRLAGIYVHEGSILGASRIIQLASARGHLEHCGIVLMRWALNRQLGYEGEAVCSMDFLSSKMILQERSPRNDAGIAFLPGTDLNIAYVYLHCAAHVYEEVMSAPKGKVMGYNRDSFDYFVIEAYKLLCMGVSDENLYDAMCWYGNYETWLEMGIALENTAFSLIAEESFFESFIRAPLCEEALKRYLACLVRRKGEAQLYNALAKALELFPLNLYGRAYMVDLESRPTFMKYAVWTALFKYQDKMATIIQALGRGYMIRVRRQEIKDSQLRKLKYFKIGVKKALERAAEIVGKRKADAFRGWMDVTFTNKGERYMAVTKIQRQVRRRQSMIWYRGALLRVARANKMFLLLAENHNLYAQQGVFRFWYALAIKERKRRSALVLIHTLGRSLIIDDYNRKKQVFIAVGTKHRRNAIQFLFSEWKRRYSKIQQVRGMAIIRQSMRLLIIRRRLGQRPKTADVMSPRPQSRGSVQTPSTATRGSSRGSTRRAIREKLAKQAAEEAAGRELSRKKLESAFAEENEPKETSHQRMLSAKVLVRLQATWWRRWMRAMKVREMQHARCKVAQLLPRLLARRRGRETFTRERVRYESQSASLKRIWCRRVGEAFRRWRGIYMVLNFQRIVHNVISRIRWKESVQRGVRIEELQDKVARNFKRKMFAFMVLGLEVQRREYNSASRKISAFFRKLVTRKILSRNCRRKIWQGKLLVKMHLSMLRYGFRRFHTETLLEVRADAAKTLFRCLKKAYFHLCFMKWKEQTVQQTVGLRLRELLVARRIVTRFGTKHLKSVSTYSARKAAEERIVALKQSRTLFSRWQERSALRLTGNAAMSVPAEIASIATSNDGDNWFVEVPPKPALVDVESFAPLRAFRAWMITYRLSKEAKSYHLTQDAAMFFYSVVNSVMLRQRASIKIQCCARRYLSTALIRELRASLRQERECIDAVQKRKLKRIFAYGISLSARKVNARNTLYRFMDHFLNRMRLKRRRAKLRRMAEKVYRWEMSLTDSKRKVLKTTFDKMITLFYAKKLQTLLSAGPSSFPLRDDDTAAANTCISESIEYGVSRTVELHGRRLFVDDTADDDYCLSSSALPRRLSRRSPADAGVYEFIQTGASFASPGRSSSQKRRKSVAAADFDPFQWLAEDSRISPRSANRLQPLTKDFESIEYHSVVFRLRETGCFFLDTSNMKLTRLEVEKCLSEADVLICSYTTSRCIVDIIRHFRGSKITFVGGTLRAMDVRGLCNFLRARTNDISVDITEVNITSASLKFQLIYDIILPPDSDAAPSPAPGLSHGPIREKSGTSSLLLPISLDQRLEGGKVTAQDSVGKVQASLRRGIRSLKKLSLDASTIGSLPMMVLISAMQYNNFIETLYLSVGEHFVVPGFGVCLRQLADNSSLKEFRISGCRLTADALSGILYAVENGLPSLERLDVVVALDDESSRVSSQIIEVARARNQRLLSADTDTNTCSSYSTKVAYLSVNFI